MRIRNVLALHAYQQEHQTPETPQAFCSGAHKSSQHMFGGHLKCLGRRTDEALLSTLVFFFFSSHPLLPSPHVHKFILYVCFSIAAL